MGNCATLQAVTYGIRPISAGRSVEFEPCIQKGTYKCSKCGKFFCYLHITSVETSKEFKSVEIIKGLWVWTRPSAYFCKECSPRESDKDPNAQMVLVKDPRR